MTKHADIMPQLGMGTFRLKGNVVYKSVTTALEIGYRHIDTAQFYENEAEVGQAIRDSGIRRDEVFITTKVWNDHLNKPLFLESVNQSLTKLQTDSVDLLLIHWPSPPNGEPKQEYLGELLKAKERGLTKNIGVSNFTISHLKETMKLIPVGEIFTNQVEVHPYLTNTKLRSFCNEQGIHVTAYMPFAVGKVLKDATIRKIGNNHGVTPAEVVIAWELAYGMATIPSSTKREHLELNLRAKTLQLSSEEISQIDALDCGNRQAVPGFAPEWD